jgi:hypothetical protein
MIGERMLQLEKAFDHGPAQLAFRELVRKCCHRQPMSVPHSGVSGILKGVREQNIQADPPIKLSNERAPSIKPSTV